MSLFKLLRSKQKPRNVFKNDEEYKFFIENRHLLNKFQKFAFLHDNENDEFEIMRANIILHGFINMQTIEMEVKSLHEYGQDTNEKEFNNALKNRIVDLPYFSERGNKIFIPFFSRAINDIYSREPMKLLKEPYASLHNHFDNTSVDPFDTYGASLYNSFFTALVKVGSNGKECAYFHYDTNTIYIVNDQGRLDESIVLFDKYLRRPNYNHMLERIIPVIERYFSNDKEGFIKALLDNHFISNKLYSMIEKR